MYPSSSNGANILCSTLLHFLNQRLLSRKFSEVWTLPTPVACGTSFALTMMFTVVFCLVTAGQSGEELSMRWEKSFQSGSRPWASSPWCRYPVQPPVCSPEGLNFGGFERLVPTRVDHLVRWSRRGQ